MAVNGAIDLYIRIFYVMSYENNVEITLTHSYIFRLDARMTTKHHYLETYCVLQEKMNQLQKHADCET